jgi:hypothetical protein
VGEESVERALGRLEGKVDQIIQTLQDAHEESAEQEARIDSLEHTRTKQNAIIGVFGVFVAAVGGVIMKALNVQ